MRSKLRIFWISICLTRNTIFLISIIIYPFFSAILTELLVVGKVSISIFNRNVWPLCHLLSVRHLFILLLLALVIEVLAQGLVLLQKLFLKLVILVIISSLRKLIAYVLLLLLQISIKVLRITFNLLMSKWLLLVLTIELL